MTGRPGGGVALAEVSGLSGIWAVMSLMVNVYGVLVGEQIDGNNPFLVWIRIALELGIRYVYRDHSFEEAISYHHNEFF